MNEENNYDILKDSLEKRIAGEIVLASEPGQEMRRWREIFKISQKDLSIEMDVSPSVISDYESMRRSPGSGFIKSFVHGLLVLDRERGSVILKEFSSFEGPSIENAILDVKNFNKNEDVLNFLNKTNSEILVGDNFLKKKIGGYIIIDSKKAVLSLAPKDISKIYNISLNKAVIFTDIRSGKTLMTAVKILGIRPDIIILHGVGGSIDSITERIAQTQKIPLAACKLSSIDDVIEVLDEEYK